jgi:hypothetical protein
VCYIVGHHHTISSIDGLDFQIQWEADLLVNLERMEIRDDKPRLEKFIKENFKTGTGNKIALENFMSQEILSMNCQVHFILRNTEYSNFK